MAQLPRTLSKLKSLHVVKSWQPFSEQSAEVVVTNGKKFNLLIAEEFYGVKLADVVEAHQLLESKNLRLDIVLVNGWQEITGEALNYCKQLNIAVFGYTEFIEFVRNLPS
jgi:hypothetical protein